jgi:hypothetical protein
MILNEVVNRDFIINNSHHDLKLLDTCHNLHKFGCTQIQTTWRENGKIPWHMWIDIEIRFKMKKLKQPMNTEKIWYSHAPQKSPGIDTERTHSSNFFMSVSSSQGLTSNRTDDLPPGQPRNTSIPSSKFKTAQVSSKSQQIDHTIQM